jgi:plastocyanin
MACNAYVHHSTGRLPVLRKGIVASVTLVVMLVVGNAAFAKESFALKGEVYPNFKIEMKNAANKPLKTIKAGTYRIKIEDKSAIHDFHLVGPGVSRSTSVAFTGERIWTVRLKPGKYVFMCDPHATQMRGSFRVTR